MSDDRDQLVDEEGDPLYVDDEFLERLEAVEATREQIEDLQKNLEGLNIGLDADDTERLLWARMSGWSLSDVQGAFEAVDDVRNRPAQDLHVRLLAQLGGMAQDDAREFLAECARLRQKYGDRREA